MMTSVEEQQAATGQTRAGSSLCEECNSNAFKYKCPACSRRTCSLSCVNSHKQRLTCTGRKDPTVFVPLSKFDDSTLLSDYNLLEDVKRVAESARRMHMKLGKYPQFRPPFNLNALRNALDRKGTKLLLLPSGMSKREKNKTHMHRRTKAISWTIEWRFHSADVVLIEHGVLESSTLRSAIEKHLQLGPWRNKLRRFCEEDLDNLKFFIRKHHEGSKSPYRELDLNVPLSELFTGLIILEYPAIHVFLPSDSYDFEVVKDVRPPPIRTQSTLPKRVESPSAVGKIFKEEEIVEDERAPEPQIIDLQKSSGADDLKPTSQGAQVHCKLSIDSSNSRSVKSSPTNVSGREIAEADKTVAITWGREVHYKQSICSSNSRSAKTSPINVSGKEITEADKAFAVSSGREVEMFDAKVDDFDFDQDLIDAYSFLMEQSNPDDFLDYRLEGEGEGHKLGDMCFPDVEELEEGEIAVNSD